MIPRDDALAFGSQGPGAGRLIRARRVFLAVVIAALCSVTMPGPASADEPPQQAGVPAGICDLAKHQPFAHGRTADDEIAYLLGVLRACSELGRWLVAEYEKSGFQIVPFSAADIAAGKSSLTNSKHVSEAAAIPRFSQYVVEIKASIFAEPVEALAALAHELSHVADAVNIREKIQAFDRAIDTHRAELIEKRARDRIAARTWLANLLHPLKMQPALPQPEPTELREKQQLRDALIEMEEKGFALSRAVFAEMGLPCIYGGNWVRSRGASCEPIRRDELREDLRGRSRYAPLFSSSWAEELLDPPEAEPQQEFATSVAPPPTVSTGEITGSLTPSLPPLPRQTIQPQLIGGEGGRPETAGDELAFSALPETDEQPNSTQPPGCWDNCATLDLSPAAEASRRKSADRADDAVRDAARAEEVAEREAAQEDRLNAHLAAQEALVAETMAAHDQAVAEGAAYTEKRDREAAAAAAAEADRARQVEEPRDNEPAPPPTPEATQPAPPPYRAPEGDDSADTGDDRSDWTPPAGESIPVDTPEPADPNDGQTPSGEPPPAGPVPAVDPRYAQGYTETDIYREDHPEEFAPPEPQPILEV